MNEPNDETRHGVLSLLILICCAFGLAAQEKKTVEVHIPLPQRETVKGEDGRLEWAVFGERNCPTCHGTKTHACQFCVDVERHQTCAECNWTKKSPCRTCAGSGKAYDPLQGAPCPSCVGAGIFPCQLCHREGHYPEKGAGAKESKCTGCKTKGAYDCKACRGDRIVDGMRLKGGIEAADVEELEAAKAALALARKNLRTYRITNKTTDDVRNLDKALKDAAKYCPPLKKVKGAIDEVMRGLKKGDAFVGNDEVKAHAFRQMVANVDLYLQHQDKVLDICLERARHNEKAAQGSGPK